MTEIRSIEVHPAKIDTRYSVDLTPRIPYPNSLRQYRQMFLVRHRSAIVAYRAAVNGYHVGFTPAR